MKNVVIIYLKVDHRLFLKQVYFILLIVAVNIPSSIFIEENPFVGISYFVAINKNRLEEYSKLKVCRFFGYNWAKGMARSREKRITMPLLLPGHLNEIKKCCFGRRTIMILPKFNQCPSFQKT